VSEELKPCAHCGEPAEMDMYSPFRHYRTGEPLTQVSVYCTGCSANVSWYPGDLSLSREETVEHVTELWNARASLPAAASVEAGDCVQHLRDKASGFRAEAKRQRETVGPLARAYEHAADELERHFALTAKGKDQADG